MCGLDFLCLHDNESLEWHVDGRSNVVDWKDEVDWVKIKIRLFNYALSCNINHNKSSHVTSPQPPVFARRFQKTGFYLGTVPRSMMWEMWWFGAAMPSFQMWTMQSSKANPFQRFLPTSKKAPGRHRERFDEKQCFFLGGSSALDVLWCIWIWRCFEGTWVKMDILEANHEEMLVRDFFVPKCIILNLFM